MLLKLPRLAAMEVAGLGLEVHGYLSGKAGTWATGFWGLGFRV